MKSRAANIWQQLQASFWFLPSLMAALAAMLAVLAVTLDRRLGLVLHDQGWFWTGEAAGARDILTTIAGSMITVAGVAFSITIVALTLAASQFGPRLLRNFMRDTGNQVVLGTFIATFLYCLLVLRVVRASADALFVPQIAVSVALLLALASLGVLIYFIHHIAMTLQAENLAAGIADEMGELIEHLFPQKLGESPEADADPSMIVPADDSSELRAVPAPRSGYLQAIENERLVAAAAGRDLVLCVHCVPGEFIASGSPLLDAWPARRVDDETAHELAGMFLLGRHRTPTQDARYPMHQLVSIAVRALSPGINDPFTATICIDWIGDALRQLGERRIPSRFRLDGEGVLRVVAAPLTFAELADVALNPVRQFGAGHVTVVLRLLETVAMVSERARRPADRVALRRHAALILEAAEGAGHLQRDLEQIRAHYWRVLGALANGRASDSRAGPERSDRG